MLMDNNEHVEWLLEGVKKWNELRRGKTFTPNLSNAEIYSAF